MSEPKSDKSEGTQNIAVRLPAHLHRKAKALASLQGRSLQEVAKELWLEWIAQQESKEVSDEQ